MTEGLNWKGDWASGTTYYKGDIVRWQNAAYLLTVSNNEHTLQHNTAAAPSGLWF